MHVCVDLCMSILDWDHAFRLAYVPVRIYVGIVVPTYLSSCGRLSVYMVLYYRLVGTGIEVSLNANSIQFNS